MNIFPGSSCQLTSKQEKIRSKFYSAKSVNEMLKCFKDLERCFPENDLNLASACFTLAVKLFHEKEATNSQKVYDLAKKSFDITQLECNTGSRLCVATLGVLQLLGQSCYKLNRHEESLAYLNWALSIIENVHKDQKFVVDDNALRLLSGVHRELFYVNSALHRPDEAIAHIGKVCEILEKISITNKSELAEAYREAIDGYTKVGKFKEALHLYMKTLEIYKEIHGEESKEVAICRENIGNLYVTLLEFDKGLEHNLLSRKAFKKLGCSSLLLSAEIKASLMLNFMGRHEEAIEILMRVVPQTGKLSKNRINAFTYWGKALLGQGKFEEAKKCADNVCEILDKLEKSDPLEAAEGFMRIADVYKLVSDFEASLSALMRVSKILETLPIQSSLHFPIRDVYLQIARMLQVEGKVEQAIPYLLKSVETMKRSFGCEHFEVGVSYLALGLAYLETNEFESALRGFVNAKDVLDKALGPLHPHSINACDCICKTYTAMQSYSLAIKTLEEKIGRLQKITPSAQVELIQAASLMDDLKAKADNCALAIKLPDKVIQGLEQEPPSNDEDELSEAASKLLATSKKNKSKKKKKKSKKKDGVLESFKGLTIS